MIGERKRELAYMSLCDLYEAADTCDIDDT
jgi:hypothetical protein